MYGATAKEDKLSFYNLLERQVKFLDLTTIVFWLHFLPLVYKSPHADSNRGNYDPQPFRMPLARVS